MLTKLTRTILAHDQELKVTYYASRVRGHLLILWRLRRKHGNR